MVRRPTLRLVLAIIITGQIFIERLATRIIELDRGQLTSPGELTILTS